MDEAKCKEVGKSVFSSYDAMEFVEALHNLQDIIAECSCYLEPYEESDEEGWWSCLSKW